MIIVGIKNGLGNQMFQYAFGKVLEWKYNTDILFDVMVYEDSTDMEVFNIGEYRICDKSFVKKFQPFSVAQFRIRKEYLKYVYYKFRRYWNPAKLVLEPLPSMYNRHFETLNLKLNYYFMGHWMNLVYFEGYEEKIKELFELKDKTFYESEIAQEILNSEYDTVSLHIRRGDYLTAGFVDNKGLDYYEEAFRIIEEKISNPFVYVFTNDADWVKKEMKLPYPMKVVEGNNGTDSYKDMVLMSLCENNIIANSSFSWWGAYLNKNEKAVIISPRIWFSDTRRNTYVSEMLPKTWIKI